MHCYNFKALKETTKGWEQVWEKASASDSDDYCMLTCPGIRMRFVNPFLVLDLPPSPGPDCKDMFHREKYSWNGKTFVATTEHPQTK
jgi:hypothetical protein